MRIKSKTAFVLELKILLSLPFQITVSIARKVDLAFPSLASTSRSVLPMVLSTLPKYAVP